MFHVEHYDVIVIGAGHAGVEAANISEKYGPEAVALTCHHDPNTQFYRHLLSDLYGSPNMYAHTSGCEQDRRSACLTLFGHVFPMHDFANSKYVILWGMNMLGANQGLFESRAILEAKKRGCKLVVIDPAFTETTVTKAFSGRFARGLRNRFIDEHEAEAPFGYPEVHYLTGPVRAAAVRAGDPHGTSVWAGSGFDKAVSAPAAQIVEQLRVH